MKKRSLGTVLVTGADTRIALKESKGYWGSSENSVEFEPQLPGQVYSVGTTRPTPLPGRVGAKQSTCSPIMPQIVTIETAEHDAVRRGEAGGLNLLTCRRAG